MQNTSRKKIEKPRSKDLAKDESPLSSKTMQDVKNGVSTPRNYLQKTTPSDIYGKKKHNVLQAPKKSTAASSSNARNVSPMKDFLRSTPSSVSHASIRSSSKMATDRKSEANAIGLSARRSTPRVVKAQAASNVTVNSPITKRKLNLTKERSNISINSKINDATKNMATGNATKSNSNMADIFTRQRSKTRTLDDNEVKVFKPDVVDNNAEMKNLTQRLSAKPKSFYVDLNGGKPKTEKDKSSEEEVSYEDDFESYESDFDSYHSESQSCKDSSGGEEDLDEEQSPEEMENDPKSENEMESAGEMNAKDNKDEEKMLDSGSYDLRETQRSAQKSKPAMLDFILEGEEGEKRASLIDEGFQDMSTSSAVSSIKTLHIDILERPLFVDFTTSKRNRRKRRIFERLQRRAEDILGMVTLHEMKFTLFEMKPVPYDTYMAAFGRSNCAQTSTQTLEDAITVEVQTDEVSCDIKWTQYPVKFSKYDVCLIDKTKTDFKEDLARRFTVLLNPVNAVRDEVKEESYDSDPMRIYIEQKKGVGPDKIQPKDVYLAKLKSADFNVKRLKKFLNRAESRISRILSMNAGNPDMSGAVKTTKLPFSKSYVSIPIDKANLSLTKHSKVTDVFISETRSNFIITVQENSSSIPKSILCLWDLSLTTRKPLKMLVATDNVAIGRFRGGADGIVVASLIDGTVHLWDLSERAAWMYDDNTLTKPVDAPLETDSEKLTQTELDREWNRLHGNRNLNKGDICLMQTSAYTSSGTSVVKNDSCDRVVGLEFLCGAQMNSNQDGERKIVAQICSLQRTGILSLWSIVQDRQRYSLKDIGKAFWSKLALEKVQTLDLSERLELCMQSKTSLKDTNSFDLNAAKKRISVKWREKQTSNSSDRTSADVARPRSARKRVLQLQEGSRNNWETGLVCYDLRVMRIEGAENFLIAKNCGEVLSCSRYAGVFKLNRFLIANDTSAITCLQVSQNGLPYFLAATETGTVSLCSIQDLRVLLTLDSRNTTSVSSEKFNPDSKGRYVGSTTRSTSSTNLIHGRDEKMTITSLVWSPGNPFEVGALLGDGALVAWRLTSSDIAARRVEAIATKCSTSPDSLALITPQNEVQVHRLNSEVKDSIELFKRYTSLL